MEGASALATDVLGWALSQLGVAGVVGAGTLVSVGMAAIWGYRLSWFIGGARSLLKQAAIQGVVAVVLLVVVVSGALYYGVIPELRMARLVELAVGVVTGGGP
jgi:hypothetical protein